MANLGAYFRSRQLPTSIRVKAYSQPPAGRGGRYLATLDPGTYFGPAEAVIETDLYTAVLVRGFWMNVAAKESDGVRWWTRAFAYRVPESEVQRWRMDGWRD